MKSPFWLAPPLAMPAAPVIVLVGERSAGDSLLLDSATDSLLRSGWQGGRGGHY